MSDITDMSKKKTAELKREVLDYCAGRLDKDALKKVGDMIDSHAGALDYELEQLVDKKGAAGGTVAMDSARFGYDVQPRSFGTSGNAVREMQAIQAAMSECAPHIAGQTMAYDSAAAVYAHALTEMGHRDKLQGVPPEGYQPIYRMARDIARNGQPTPSRMAVDSAAKSFDQRFPGASKLTVR